MPRNPMVWPGLLTMLCLAGPSPAQATDATEAAFPPVWLSVRVVTPRVQVERTIDLCRGTRASSPAAALAAWKFATGGREGPGKTLEAIIAALNPEMARELRPFDGTRVFGTVDPETGQPRWQAVFPGDDGSLRAVGTALALTGGVALEPVGPAQAVRLGPPGALVAASQAGRFAVASTPAVLATLLDPAFVPGPALDPRSRSGWDYAIDPAALRRLAPLRFRRAAAVLDSLGCRDLDGHVELVGPSVTAEARTRLAAPEAPAPIDPAWLEAVPARQLGALACVALGSDGSGVARLLAAADRVEKADPAFAGVAPVRLRLNLMLTAGRVRPDADLWSVLRGLTAAVLVDPQGQTRGALVGLHTRDADAASRIATTVLPRLASVYLKDREKPSATVPSDLLGHWRGRPVRAHALGASVWIGWGDGVLEESGAAADRPDGSAASVLRAAWGDAPPQRLGAAWPGRWAGAIPGGTELVQALADAPPVVWVGRTHGETADDLVRWDGLDRTVGRWLAALPLTPPPDRASPPGPERVGP